jgi:cysteinyl-tRNA synthetase
LCILVDGDVYYSVDSFLAYGRLSGRSLEDNRAGERVAVDERKRNPADFVLWKVRIPVFSSSILYFQNGPFYG